MDDLSNEVALEKAKANQEIAKAVSKGIDLSEKLGPFISKVLGEPIESAIGIVGDRLKFMRYERQLRIMERVKEINSNKGIHGYELPIPPKLAIPILENASLELDNELQNYWINLMSSCQDRETQPLVRSAYIDVIKQLEVVDGKILQLLFNSYNRYYNGVVIDDYIQANKITILPAEGDHYRSPTAFAFSKYSILEKIKITESEYENAIDNLMRVQCICSEVIKIPFPDLRGGELNSNRGYESICMTAFGVQFVTVCIK